MMGLCCGDFYVTDPRTLAVPICSAGERTIATCIYLAVSKILRRCILQCIMCKSVLYHPLSSKVVQASYSQQAMMWLVTSSTRQSVSFLTSFRFHQLRVVRTIISPPTHHRQTLHSEQLDLPFILLLIQG